VPKQAFFHLRVDPLLEQWQIPRRQPFNSNLRQKDGAGDAGAEAEQAGIVHPVERVDKKNGDKRGLGFDCEGKYNRSTKKVWLTDA
jgi:hypothetical protein